MQENSHGQPAEKKIICISWQPQGQPERATAYYHADCYSKCPVILPDGEKREIARDEVAPYEKCASCGWFLNF